MRAVWSVMLCLAACGDSSNQDMKADAPMGEAVLSVSPMAYDFGSTGAGTSSPFAAFFVRNTGNRTSGQINTQIVFTHASLFRIINDGCDGGMLAPGGNCELQIQFRSEAPLGVKEAHLLVDTDPGGEALVPISGTSVPNTGPRLVTTGAPGADFGNVANNTVSPAFNFVITNPGTSATGHIDTKLTGVNATAYSVQTSCSIPLPSGNTCMVSVQFKPTMLGIQPASVEMSGTPGGMLVLPLTGNAISVALTSTATSKDFGLVEAATMSQPFSITVQNTGTQMSGPVSLTLTGTDTNEYEIGTNSCMFISLSPGSTCFVEVTFRPSGIARGRKVANLRINASNSIVNVALAGTAVVNGGGFITSSSASLTFGNQAVNTASATQSLTIMNTGTTATGSITIATSGAAASAFTTTTNCTTLAPATSCDVIVGFRPTATGAAQASVSVTANGSNTVPVSVQGTGI
ncbi:MAG: choice-of-anchor D domain-containing protein [Deltaproteobacteria bacterium]|nr:choice-of-anchor D domain-containing protein [Deltaproteobacteria bacterium]